MAESTGIREALFLLRNYIEKENYSGYDPYDALTSPLFRLPFFKSNKWVRFGIQQLVKRSPVNLRPMLGIPKGLNPVTLGLCIQGYTAMGMAGLEKREVIDKLCEPLIAQLQKSIPPGFHGACWGYNFPWQARYATIPAHQPTVVATGIITNALFSYYNYTGNTTAFNLCDSACHFILSDLNRTTDESGAICFSYSPFDKNCVFNASMKGARTLIQVYSVKQDPVLLDVAEKAVRFVMNRQNADGSWYYSTAPRGNWIDSYHTGYVLDCLHEYIRISSNSEWKKSAETGFAYFINALFSNGYKPKFFHNREYPLDCTAAGQAILTLCRYGQTEMAVNTAQYVIDEMQSSHGNFYFRKYRLFTEKHPFMRWSDAWMFAALATVVSKSNL